MGAPPNLSLENKQIKAGIISAVIYTIGYDMIPYGTDVVLSVKKCLLKEFPVLMTPNDKVAVL